MYILEVDSIVESVLSPGEACGDFMYINNGKQCENEVYTLSWHIASELLYCPEYLIFIWNWDIKVSYVGMPLSYILRTT